MGGLLTAEGRAGIGPRHGPQRGPGPALRSPRGPHQAFARAWVAHPRHLPPALSHSSAVWMPTAGDGGVMGSGGTHLTNSTVSDTLARMRKTAQIHGTRRDGEAIAEPLIAVLLLSTTKLVPTRLGMTFWRLLPLRAPGAAGCVKREAQAS